MRVRPARRDDAELLLGLIAELADYERLSESVQADTELLAASLFDHGAAEALIAEVDGDAVGYAVLFQTFSTFECRAGLWIEDLFVRPAWRRRGLGRALFDHIAELARARGCARLEWSVLDWNEPALRFYETLGATRVDGWRTLRLAGEALERHGAERAVVGPAEESATGLVAELHRRQGEMYAGGAVEPVVELLAEDIVWHVPGASQIAGDHRGVDQVIAYFENRRRLADATMRMRPGEVVSVGDAVGQFVEGSAVVDGKPVSWRTFGVYRIDGEHRRIRETWLVPLDLDLFDLIWSRA